MRVGLSLLTLVPGVSGGSETYARELVRALGRVGRFEYRTFLPSIAPDVTGTPIEIVPEYRASRSTAGRVVAMADASLAGGRIRRRFESVDVIHFPLSVMVPRSPGRPAVTSVLDVQHELLPEFFSRAELAYRRRVYGWSVRQSALVVTISQHAAQTLVERLGLPEERVRPIHLGIDHDAFTPGEEPRGEFLLYPALGWRHKNHALLFEAFGVLREKRPGLELVLTAFEGAVPEGARALGRVPREELVVAVPDRGRARLPEPVRGLRPAAARGDGVRVPGCLLERRFAAGGGRGRCTALRPDLGRGAGRGGRGGARRSGAVARARARAGEGVHVGEDREGPRRRVRGARGANPRAGSG